MGIAANGMSIFDKSSVHSSPVRSWWAVQHQRTHVRKASSLSMPLPATLDRRAAARGGTRHRNAPGGHRPEPATDNIGQPLLDEDMERLLRATFGAGGRCLRLRWLRLGPRRQEGVADDRAKAAAGAQAMLLEGVELLRLGNPRGQILALILELHPLVDVEHAIHLARASRRSWQQCAKDNACPVQIRLTHERHRGRFWSVAPGPSQYRSGRSPAKRRHAHKGHNHEPPRWGRKASPSMLPRSDAQA